MPPRITTERHQRNIESLRALVNSRSPSVVRQQLAGGASSGARLKSPIPSIGDRSGKLTVLGYITGARGGVAQLIVRCACAADEYTVSRANFKRGLSKRCPICAKKAGAEKRYWRYSSALPDDGHRTRLLNRFSSMVGRCHNPENVQYLHYGGRGISVHQEWRDNRALFLEYCQTLDRWKDPARDIDRIDTNSNYEPGNIRFATKSENALNKRKVADLEAEITRLRSALIRAEAEIHGVERSRAAAGP